MKVKELKKILKEYSDETEIFIWWKVEKTICYDFWQTKEDVYEERQLDLQDIVDSTYNWEKKIVISMHNLSNYN